MQHTDANPFVVFSNSCITVLKLLDRYGGCLRTASLLRACALSCDELCDTLNELAQRRCLAVTWRRAPSAAALPPRLREVERVTLTSFGRSRLPVPWLWHPPRKPRRRTRGRTKVPDHS